MLRWPRSLFQSILNTTALFDTPPGYIVHWLRICMDEFPWHSKRQKTNPSLLLALKCPCTHIYVRTICAWKIQTHAFVSKWQPLGILNVVFIIIINYCYFMPWVNKIVLLFLFLFIFHHNSPTHSHTALPPCSHSLLPHSPDRKNKSHTWGLKSLFKAEHFSVQFKMQTVFSNYSILMFSS